jgi:sterol desaturase/sphingolipid hydroxylase (fatty acid hydroxylase superfamily)
MVSGNNMQWFTAGAFGVLAIFAGLIIWLSIRHPYRDQKLVHRPWFWNDLIWYAIVQSMVLGAIIAWAIFFIDARTHWSSLRLVSDWPIAVQVVFFLLSHDLFMYLAHRLTHKVDFLWRIHEAGHSVEHVDLVSGLRSHPFEILINQSIEFGAIIFLGGAPEVVVIKGLISLAWGIWLHHNIAIRTGWLQYIINGSEMHRWHHHPEHMHANFATKFAIWDWLFGTAYLPRDKVCDRYGLDDSTYPGGWSAQFLAFFRKLPSRASSSAPAPQPCAEGRPAENATHLRGSHQFFQLADHRGS